MKMNKAEGGCSSSAASLEMAIRSAGRIVDDSRILRRRLRHGSGSAWLAISRSERHSDSEEVLRRLRTTLQFVNASANSAAISLRPTSSPAVAVESSDK